MIPVRLLFEGAQNIKVTLSADGRGMNYTATTMLINLEFMGQFGFLPDA